MNHIDNPKHYQFNDDAYETIKVIEAWNLDFKLGNVIKYIARAKKKGNEKEDLMKALWYLNRAVDELK